MVPNEYHLCAPCPRVSPPVAFGVSCKIRPSWFNVSIRMSWASCLSARADAGGILRLRCPLLDEHLHERREHGADQAREQCVDQIGLAQVLREAPVLGTSASPISGALFLGYLCRVVHPEANEEEDGPVRISPPNNRLHVERLATRRMEMELSGGARVGPQVASRKLGREATQVDCFELVDLPLDLDGHTPSNIHPRMPPKVRFSTLKHAACSPGLPS